LPRIVGENISIEHPEDVDNDHFKEDWHSLKYYYLDGKYYRRCRE
jgi:hypothetical protein